MVKCYSCVGTVNLGLNRRGVKCSCELYQSRSIRDEGRRKGLRGNWPATARGCAAMFAMATIAQLAFSWRSTTSSSRRYSLPSDSRSVPHAALDRPWRVACILGRIACFVSAWRMPLRAIRDGTSSSAGSRALRVLARFAGIGTTHFVLATRSAAAHRVACASIVSWRERGTTSGLPTAWRVGWDGMGLEDDNFFNTGGYADLPALRCRREWVVSQ